MRGRKSVLSSVTNQIPDIIVWYKPATRPPTHSPFIPPPPSLCPRPSPLRPLVCNVNLARNLYALPRLPLITLASSPLLLLALSLCLSRLGPIIASYLDLSPLFFVFLRFHAFPIFFATRRPTCVQLRCRNEGGEKQREVRDRRNARGVG